MFHRFHGLNEGGRVDHVHDVLLRDKANGALDLYGGEQVRQNHHTALVSPGSPSPSPSPTSLSSNSARIATKLPPRAATKGQKDKTKQRTHVRHFGTSRWTSLRHSIFRSDLCRGVREEGIGSASSLRCFAVEEDRRVSSRARTRIGSRWIRG